VIGTMLLAVAINLVKLWPHQSPCTEFAEFCCALGTSFLRWATIGLTLLFARILGGIFGQLCSVRLLGDDHWVSILHGVARRPARCSVFPFGRRSLI